MLQSLLSLSDTEIEEVMYAVTRWCSENSCQFDSAAGRHALSVAVELVQTKGCFPGFFVSLSRLLKQ